MAALLLALSACSWIVVLCEGTQVFTVKLGEDVPLQCRDPRGAAIGLIEWERTDPKPEKYVFFFRDNKTIGEYQDEEFRGRVELRDPEMKDGDASVVLKNVNINDAGTYECRVSAAGRGRRRRAAEVFSTIKLTVTDPGLTAGHTEERGDKEGGNTDGHLGAALSVGGFVLAVAVVGFMIYNKRKVLTENNSYKPPADTESDHQQV